jgi:hypothetical protein
VESARRDGNGSEECASAREGDMTATAGRAAGEGVEVRGDSGDADLESYLQPAGGNDGNARLPLVGDLLHRERRLRVAPSNRILDCTVTIRTVCRVNFQNF